MEKRPYLTDIRSTRSTPEATHEDVDQLFSKIGERIRKHGCESLPGISQSV